MSNAGNKTPGRRVRYDSTLTGINSETASDGSIPFR